MSSNTGGSPVKEGPVDARPAEEKPGRCEEMVQYSLQRCPRVKFLREKLEKLGCEMPRQSFACRPCEGMDISGGFVPPTKDAKGNLSPAEIRASNTSGECSFNMEFRRGHMKWGGQQKECVKRRAELSVQATPGCSERAKEFVNSAFKPCYYDTAPYDKNPP